MRIRAGLVGVGWMREVGMQIEYCEACHKRVTDHDFDVGVAAWLEEQVYCKTCLEKKGFAIQIPGPSSGAKRTPSGRMISISGSGIRKVPSGSAIRKVGPDSGIRSAAKGSGVHKVSTPGSGIHKYPKQGSGVRKASRASSGVQTIPRSGILAAHRGTSSKSSGRLSKVKSRWYGRRADKGSESILFMLLAGAAFLLLAGGMYVLFR